MSEVKRFLAALGFDPEPYVDMIEDGDGTYVYYEDYEALRAKLAEAQREIGRMNISLELQADRVDKLIDENVKAEAENATLYAKLKLIEGIFIKYGKNIDYIINHSLGINKELWQAIKAAYEDK